MDPDNRQGQGFDQNTGGAPGQQSFFFNQQQQQQLIQNQLMQKQGAPGSQISQTPQMMPAQRSMFAMQGQQPLFQQAQLGAPGVEQLPGGAQFAGSSNHDAMRQEMHDGQSVGGANHSANAHQMKILGFQPGGSYAAGQDQLLQQRQQPYQQMHQQQRMGMPGVLGDSSSFIGQSTGAPGQSTQLGNPNQSQIPSQFQQTLLGMSNTDMSRHQSIPQTPQQNPFMFPQHLMQSQDLGNLHQTQQSARQQPGTQQPQFHGVNNNQSSGNAGTGAGAQNNQAQSNVGNNLLGGNHTSGQSNLPASLQQQLAQAQGQTNPQGQQSITNQFLNQLLSSHQSQGGAPPPIFSQMKPNGQWPQSQSQAANQTPQQLNQTPNHNASQNRQNEQSSSHHQMTQPIQKPAQMQQPQPTASQKGGMDGQLQMDNRGNFHQMWQMQQQNNLRQTQQDDHRLQQQFQQPGQNQAQSNAETPSQQPQAKSFQGGNQGQNQQLHQSFLGQQQQQQNNKNHGQDGGIQQHFRENPMVKQEQKQSAQSPFPQHGQMQPSQAQQLFAGNPDQSHSIEQAAQQQNQQLHGQGLQQQFYQGQQSKSANEAKPNESQQQQFYPGYGNQQQDGSAQGINKPQQQQQSAQPGQMNLAGFQNSGAPGMNRLLQGSREQSYHGAQDQEGKGPMSNQHQLLFSHFNQFNQQPTKQDQTSNSQQQQQPGQNPLGNLLQMSHSKPQTPAPFSQYQQQQQNQNSSVQSSLQQALGDLQHKNKGGLPYQALGGGGLGGQGQQSLQLPNTQQTPSMQPASSQHLHNQNQNLMMQFGMQQSASQQPQLDQRGQQPGNFGMPQKQESVSQQHLLAAISSMSQGGPQDAANSMPKAIQQNGLFMPGQGQNPLQMGAGQPKMDGINMNGILGGGSNQGGDQPHRPDMLTQFGPDGQTGGNQVSVPGVGASQSNGMDPNMLQLQLNQQQPNQEWNISSIPSLSKMAEFCATRGDYQQAIEYYRQLITHDPNNGASWTALGHCYLLTEDIHKAFTAYQHALYSVEDMNDPQLWYGIGILYERFESYDNAISALIGVLKMSPNFYQKSEVLYKLGTIFAKTNQIDQASKFFQNSILTSSFSVKKKVDTLIKIGLLNEEKKDFQQAKRSFEAALSLNDKNVRVYQHLAWCSFRHGNIESALRYITKAEKRSKDNAYSTYIKGRCLICLDSTQEAFECLSQAAQQLPSEAVFWTSLAVLMYNMGKINVSFEVITQATTLKHELWEVWYNLGILYETCKQPEEALIAYDMVLSIDPKQPDAQKRIVAIKQCKYQEEMNDSKNPVQLQMKHPSYCIPNTLTILRNYWKHQDNKQQTTLHPVQPPQDGMPMAGADSGPPAMPMRIETGNGDGQLTQQPPTIQLSQNALQQLQPSSTNDANQINLGNLSKPFGEQPNFDKFGGNDGNDNQQQQHDQGANKQNVGQNSSLQQFNQQQPQLKQLEQPDLQNLVMQKEQQVQQQQDHASQLMQKLQQQQQKQNNVPENSGKSEQDYGFKFGNQNNNEDGGQSQQPNQMQLQGQSTQGNIPQQMMAMNQAQNQNQFPSSGSQNPMHPSAQQLKPQVSGVVGEQQPIDNNGLNTEGAPGQKDPIGHELFSRFQQSFHPQMQGGSNPSQPDSQQPPTQQHPLQTSLQPADQKPPQQPQQQLMQGHYQSLNNTAQQQQPGSENPNNNKVESQQQAQFEQFMQNSNQVAAEWQQLQQKESNQQVQAPDQQTKQEQHHQQFNNFPGGQQQNNQSTAQQQQTMTQGGPQQQVEQEKQVQMAQTQQFYAQQQQIGSAQDGVNHPQNTQQLGGWQTQRNELKGVLPPTIGQAARPSNEANNPVGNGPKDDETEQELSSDDNNGVAQGPPQVNHSNFQAMQVLNAIPMSNVNPSDSFNASQKSNQQRMPSQAQQQPLDLNVEGANVHNDQYRKKNILGFQQQSSQQQLGLQATQNPESNTGNVLGFTNAQNPSMPAQPQLGLQQPADGQQNPIMGGSNMHAGEDNQNDMLGFGLGELAGKFKTSAADELDPPQVEGISANDQNNVEQLPHQPAQQQPSHGGLNPEQSSSKQYQPNNASHQQQVDIAKQHQQIQHANSGPSQPQNNGSDNNHLYSQHSQQNPGQAPTSQQPHEANNQGNMLGLLPPKPTLGLTQPTQQQPQFPVQKQDQSGYHSQSHHQQQQSSTTNPDQNQQSVFQQQQQTSGPQGAANLGGYPQHQQQQSQMVQQPNGSETGGHYGAQGSQQQNQFHPLLRKMPFIAQTQLGFAPMQMGGGEQPHDQRQAFQMKQEGNNPSYSEQQQQQMPPQSNNQNDNGQGQQ